MQIYLSCSVLTNIYTRKFAGVPGILLVYIYRMNISTLYTMVLTEDLFYVFAISSPKVSKSSTTTFFTDIARNSYL